MKFCSDVLNRVGTPKIKMFSDVYTRAGTPHIEMCSDVRTRVGTPHIEILRCSYWGGDIAQISKLMRWDGWVGG